MFTRHFLSSCLFVIGLSQAASALAQPMVATTNTSHQVQAPISFTAWKTQLRDDALANGISAAVFDQAMQQATTIDSEVLRLDRSQPEFTRPVWEYLDGAVSAVRVKQGKKKLQDHSSLLAQIYQHYGVEPEVLVAIWGMESNFGSFMGGKSVIRSLATLAYEGRRSEFWRSELLSALRIIQSGDISVVAMKGSWAGAMGQTQFMPGTYERFAVDFDGDGKRDIWHSKADALGSAANYLNQFNWQKGVTWGGEVRLKPGFDYALADSQTRRSLAQWQQLGVTLVSTTTVSLNEPATLFLPAGHQGPAFLLLDNFRSILKYNNSSSYALAIGLLSDQLQGKKSLQKNWPIHEKPLSLAERIETQERLNQLGFNSGATDGVIGVNTRRALQAFQQAQGVPADGYLTHNVLNMLRQAR